MRPATTQISLRIHAVWSGFSLIGGGFYRLPAIQRGVHVNINPCHTGWICRLIWVFAGRKSLIVGYFVRWLNYNMLYGEVYGTNLWPQHDTKHQLQWRKIKKNINKQWMWFAKHEMKLSCGGLIHISYSSRGIWEGSKDFRQVKEDPNNNRQHLHTGSLKDWAPRNGQ